MPHIRLARSRSVIATALGIALAMVLVGVQPATAQSDRADQSRSAQPSSAGPDGIVPLSADLRIDRSSIDADGVQQTEQEIRHVYRDSQARIRTEAGSAVTISDPANGTMLVLDDAAETYRLTTNDPAGVEAADRPTALDDSSGQITSEPRSLGLSRIDGVSVEGTEYTVTTPALGDLPVQQRTVTQWLSTDVQLPVQSRVEESTGEVYTQTYTNIRAGVEQPADLFQVPAGYDQMDRAGTSDGITQTTCTIRNDDPVIMTSFDLVYLDSRTVFADTDPLSSPDPLNPCVFIADAAAFQYPLDGYPKYDLGNWYDDWFVYDNGGLLPFLPYQAFGEIAFAAAHPQGGPTTITSSFISLTVFPA